MAFLVSEYCHREISIQFVVRWSITDNYFDFIYIDGSHYYNDIKNDYLNSKAILSIHDNYKGKICGDDYEFSRNELEKIFNDSSNLDKLLKLNKDYIHINKKNLKTGFHPGVTRFFSEIADKIIKTKSGFWYLE